MEGCRGVLRCVTANGGDVDHAVAEFDKSTPIENPR